VTIADGPAAFAAALREHGGARLRPDDEVREWAFRQTARAQNEPVWARLEGAGIDLRPKLR
jgi:hypothetical protein